MIIKRLLLIDISDFELDTWYNSLGLTPGSVLSLANKEQLMNQLGIRSYLRSKQCSFTSDMFSPDNDRGWKNGVFTFCRL